MDEDEVAQIRERYRGLAVEWGGAWDSPKRANELFDELQRLSSVARDSAEGQAAISGLMDDEDASVRLSAAAASLAYEPDKAIATLRELESAPGLKAVTAKYTLKSYFEGTLES